MHRDSRKTNCPDKMQASVWDTTARLEIKLKHLKIEEASKHCKEALDNNRSKIATASPGVVSIQYMYCTLVPDATHTRARHKTRAALPPAQRECMF